ncbi:MAG: CopG family transcriptional regulator [Proteobacteria bacterium]|nr:CopG family transcriptional regulator [Pseudomonadota bacterium]
MSTITIRLSEQVLNTIKMRAHNLHISRGEYIRNAIEEMNKTLCKKEKISRLARASQLVRQNSMIINSEFAEIEDDPEA